MKSTMYALTGSQCQRYLYELGCPSDEVAERRREFLKYGSTGVLYNGTWITIQRGW